MRFLVKAQIPTEDGNRMVQDPDLLKKFEEYISSVKAEEAYFGPINGHRGLFFVVNMDSADMIPGVVEPLFQQFGAVVDVTPVMILDDLKKAFSKT